MELTVQEKNENKLLKRVDVRFKVEFEGPTPSRKDVKERLCGVLKASPDLTIIDNLAQGFGETQIVGYAKVYADAEAMKVEPQHAGLRERGEKKAKKVKPAAPPRKRK